MISTAHNSSSIDRFDTIKNFEAILHYNKTKIGVDITDKMITDITI